MSVGVLAATGVISALAELRSFEQLWSTGYGQVLIVKTVLLAGARRAGLDEPAIGFCRVRSFETLRRSVAVELMLFAAWSGRLLLLTDLQTGPRSLRDCVGGRRADAVRRLWAQVGRKRDLAVALAVARPARSLLALDSDGRRVNGLVGVDRGAGAELVRRRLLRRAEPSSAGGSVRVRRRPHAGLPISRRARPAAALRRSGDEGVPRLAHRRLRGTACLEPREQGGRRVHARASDRLEYRIRGGAADHHQPRRWDRPPLGKWVPSPQDPTSQPEPIWAGHSTNAYLLETTPTTYVVSFLADGPGVVHAATSTAARCLPRSLRMTAPAHFMTHRYTRFNVASENRAPSR